MMPVVVDLAVVVVVVFAVVADGMKKN